MHIPNREAVEAAFAASSSRPLLAEMERRYDQRTPLRALVRITTPPDPQPTPEE